MEFKAEDRLLFTQRLTDEVRKSRQSPPQPASSRLS